MNRKGGEAGEWETLLSPVSSRCTLFFKGAMTRSSPYFSAPFPMLVNRAGGCAGKKSFAHGDPPPLGIGRKPAGYKTVVQRVGRWVGRQ